MIPVAIPILPHFALETFRGYRATKHFILFQNPRNEEAWTIATGHGRISGFGFELPETAYEMAEHFEATGQDWNNITIVSDYSDVDAIKHIIALYRPLALYP